MTVPHRWSNALFVLALAACLATMFIFSRAAAEWLSLMWNNMKHFGEHYVIVLFAAIIWWLPRWKLLAEKWDKVDALRLVIREVILVILILGIFAASAYKTERGTRARLAEVARSNVDRAFGAAMTQLEATNGVQRENLGQLVMLSLEIGQITSGIFEFVDYAYPEVKLRTLSAFLVPEKEQKVKRIEDFIQVGELEKDRPTFDPSESLVGKTIETGRRRYCADVVKRGRGDGECGSFEELPRGKRLEFSSLLCYPVTLGLDCFSAVCLDSREKHAFDGEENEIWNSIRDQVERLATVMHAFQRVRFNFEALSREHSAASKLRR